MRYIPWSELRAWVKTHGRCWEQPKMLHFNWSCCGVSLRVRATLVVADFCAACGDEWDGIPDQPGVRKRQNWPWAAVFRAGEETPDRRFQITETQHSQLLFAAQQTDAQTLHIVKLTENAKTRLALRGIWLEGELEQLPEEPPKKRIELVGDSITCGFGNLTDMRDRFFYDADEDAWQAHGPLAARKLGMDWRMISISGICLARRESLPMDYAMEDLYRYTDYPGQTAEGLQPQLWDFAAAPADYVVINLGTNDSTAAAFEGVPSPTSESFEQDYLRFLGMVRACNGPRTHIICALGSMDHYFFDSICRAVKKHCEETGDFNVSCLKYLRMSPADGFGACGHPSAATHRKMAEELCQHIARLEAGSPC